MRRLQLFELEDLSWFPAIIRNCMTDLLNFIINFFKIYDPIVPILFKALKDSHSTQILDLCSGGAGAIGRVQKLLESCYNLKLKVSLSDLYPNNHACERIALLKDSRICYITSSVDATHVPADLAGFRTLFTSFHHFDPQSARKILADAVKKQQGIAVFEFSERCLRGAFGPLVSPLLVLILTPFIKPLLWQRLFFTYLCPIIPFAFVFDGIMSQLRSYKPEEMLALAQQVNNETYIWEAGFVRHSFLPFRLNYLIGYKAPDKL